MFVCPNSLYKGRIRHIFFVIGLVGLISACAHTPSTGERIDGKLALSGDPVCRGEESLLNLLGLLDDFNRTNASGRATIYEQVSTSAVLEPTPDNRLALAIVKAMPGHHGYNLQSAQALLDTVLDNSNMLPAGVLHFARTYAESISERRRLEQSNRQLRVELMDAREKLEALTEIEREVDLPDTGIEQPNINNGSPPNKESMTNRIQ